MALTWPCESERTADAVPEGQAGVGRQSSEYVVICHTRRRPAPSLVACQFRHRVVADDDVLSAARRGTTVTQHGSTLARWPTGRTIISMARVLLHASVSLCSINLSRNNRLSATDASYSGLIYHFRYYPSSTIRRRL